jgi:hypothetical protein
MVVFGNFSGHWCFGQNVATRLGTVLLGTMEGSPQSLMLQILSRMIVSNLLIYALRFILVTWDLNFALEAQHSSPYCRWGMTRVPFSLLTLQTWLVRLISIRILNIAGVLGKCALSAHCSTPTATKAALNIILTAAYYQNYLFLSRSSACASSTHKTYCVEAAFLLEEARFHKAV